MRPNLQRYSAQIQYTAHRYSAHIQHTAHRYSAQIQHTAHRYSKQILKTDALNAMFTSIGKMVLDWVT